MKLLLLIRRIGRKNSDDMRETECRVEAHKLVSMSHELWLRKERSNRFEVVRARMHAKRIGKRLVL